MDETARVAHLQMIQGVITRMGTNSFSLKTASTTLVAALVAYYGAVPNASWTVALGAAIVIAVLWLLDANYLRLERLFRALYDEVRVTTMTNTADLYSMNITQFQANENHVLRIAISWSVIWPYLVGILLLAIVAAARPTPSRDGAPPAPATSSSVSPK